MQSSYRKNATGIRQHPQPKAEPLLAAGAAGHTYFPNRPGTSGRRLRVGDGSSGFRSLLNPLVVGRPLIPDLKTDATGTRGEVRFTVDESDLRPRGPQLVKPVALSAERKTPLWNDPASSCPLISA